jgi:hypothetical protein
LTRGAAKPLLWFCQWVRFVSTQAVEEGVESLFPVEKREFICHRNQWLPERQEALAHAQTDRNQWRNQWQGQVGILEPIFTSYALLLPYT